jgi:hypothetical protein
MSDDRLTPKLPDEIEKRIASACWVAAGPASNPGYAQGVRYAIDHALSAILAAMEEARAQGMNEVLRKARCVHGRIVVQCMPCRYGEPDPCSDPECVCNRLPQSPGSDAREEAQVELGDEVGPDPVFARSFHDAPAPQTPAPTGTCRYCGGKDGLHRIDADCPYDGLVEVE